MWQLASRQGPKRTVHLAIAIFAIRHMLRLGQWSHVTHHTCLVQENGGSEEEIALAVARAHERMLQAELAESQAGPSQPPQPQPPQQQQAHASRGGGARAAENASRATSTRQAAQLRALDREVVGDISILDIACHFFSIFRYIFCIS